MATIFIYGKIEESVEPIKDTFNNIERELKNNGNIVRNPFRQIKTDVPFPVFIRETLKIMLECDTIYLVPGWRNSRSAKLIYDIANNLKMKNYSSI